MLRFAYRFLAAALGFSALALMVPDAGAEPFKIIVTEPETPLVPNSVIDLADKMGYYKKAGVDVEIVRVRATPAAVAALSSGQGDMANIGLDLAVQLVARDQLKLHGVISPDKALPYVIVAKSAIKSPKQLEGHAFGIGQIGSVDHVQTRNVFSSLGVDADKIRYLALGQPAVRVQSLVAGQIDATTIGIGTWTTLPDKTGLSVLVDQTAYYNAAPFVTKLSVVTEDTAKKKAKEVEAVVRATILASRDFARNPDIWIDGMVKARPDVPREQLAELAKAYAHSWTVNGGLEERDLVFTTDALYKSDAFKELPRHVAPAEWIDRSFVDAVLRDVGEFKADAAKAN